VTGELPLTSLFTEDDVGCDEAESWVGGVW